MPAHLGLLLALMALLAIAGGAKILDPAPTSGALRAANLPDSHRVVRLIGGIELAVGVAGVSIGGTIPALSGAVLYTSFAVFVAHALRNRLPISSCGCLGSADTPPTRLHIVVNLLAVAVLVMSAAIPLDPFGALSSATPGEAALMLVFSGLTVYLLYALIAVLPLRKALTRTTTIAMSPGPRTPLHG